MRRKLSHLMKRSNSDNTVGTRIPSEINTVTSSKYTSTSETNTINDETESLNKETKNEVHSMKNISSNVQNNSLVVSKRHYKRVCFTVMFIYLLLHLLIGMFPVRHGRGEMMKWQSWSKDYFILICGWFSASTFLQFNRTLLTSFKEDNDIGTLSSYYASLCVNLMAGCSQISSSFYPWGGVCYDVFNVPTPASQWLEWMACVPLIMFIAISVDDKPSLSFSDYITVFMMFLCIFFGTLLQTTSSINLSIIYIILSSLCILISPYQMYLAYKDWNVALELSSLKTSKTRKGLLQRKMLLTSRKFTLCGAISVLFPIFPIIYLFRALHYMDDEVGLIATAIASAFVKILFASLCMDAHLEVSHPAVALLDAENFSKEMKHNFLRYVFHEVRVPLNSISLGLQVLASNIEPSSPEHETVEIVKDSITYINETLSDVMALQHMEEGSLQLVFRPFSLLDMFNNLEISFKSTLAAKNIKLLHSISPAISPKLIGDRVRIRHVLANLISNAIKASHPGGIIKITAIDAMVSNDLLAMMNPSVKPRSPISKNHKLITITIEDNGCGISKEVQEADIFTPFNGLQSGDIIESKGRGLGLAICREIMHLHHGWITYSSEKGKGSKFSISLPLKPASEDHYSSPLQSSRNLGGSHMDVLRPESYHLQVGNIIRPKVNMASFNYGFRQSISAGDSNSSENIGLFAASLISDHSSEDSSNSLEAISDKEEAAEFKRRLSEKSFGISLKNHSMNDTIGKCTEQQQYEKERAISTSDNEGEINMDSAKQYSSDSSVSRGIHPNRKSNKSPIKSGHDTDSILCYSASGSTPPMTETLAGLEFSDEMNAENIQSEKLFRSNSSSTKSKSSSTPGEGQSALNSSNHSSCSETSIFSFNTRKKIRGSSDDDVGSALDNKTVLSPRIRLQQELGVLAPPFYPKPQNRTEIVAPPDSPHAPPRARLHRTFSDTFKLFNLLLVDDVLSNRKLLAMLLKKKGIGQIYFAEDGEMAIESVENNGIDFFDVIFMDNTMPKKTGIDATEELRDKGYEKVIIGLTGNSFEEELAEFERVGANLVLTKPMKPNTLNAILSFLGEHGVVYKSNEKFRIIDEVVHLVNIFPSSSTGDENTMQQQKQQQKQL